MILAMTSNIMAGAKVFCNGHQSVVASNRQVIPSLSAVWADDLNAVTQPTEMVVTLQNSASAPRCSCQKPKSCMPVLRLMLTGNPLQRFNEEQRIARSVSIDVNDSLDPIDWSWQGCCGPPQSVLSKKSLTYALHDNILSLACVLLI